jgi:MoaA/NifB/PqqE/SkfB family radical SAM enzyme
VGEKHNQIRGSTTAWKSVMETIQALAPRQRELRFRLSVNQTIVDLDGVSHYRKLRDVLRPHGVQNNVVFAYDVSATYNMEKEIEVAPNEVGQFSTFGELPKDVLNELLHEAEYDLREVPFFERRAKRYYLRGIHNRLLGNSGQPNAPCVALNSHVRLFPNGDMPTCQFNSRTIGSLRRQSFPELWQSYRAEQQRNWVRRCPGCWAECEVLPNAVYTMDLLRIPSKLT